MDSISLLTIITSLAAYHIVLGTLLIASLSIWLKLTKHTAEIQSWLWATILMITTVLPLTLISPDETIKVYQYEDRKISSPQIARTSKTSTETQVNTNQDRETENQKQSSLTNLIQNKSHHWHIPSHFIFQTLSLWYLFAIVWLIGILWRLKSVFFSIIRSRKIVKEATPLKLSKQNIKFTHAEIKTSHYCQSPMAIGIFSQKIILPQSLVESLSESQIAAVILHEQAHIDRHDLWVNLIQKIIAAFFWWSPIIRYLDKKISISRELACDARAAQTLNSGKQYAQSLVDCARLMVTQNQPVLAMEFFNKKKELEQRVREILNINSMKKTSKLSIFFICFLLSFASIQAAQYIAPTVDLNKVKHEAKPYHYLPNNIAKQLIDAVGNDDISLIKKLIQQGLDINRPIRGDGTALIMAVKQKNQRLVNDLINIGADVNQAARGDGNPLIIAAMTNQLDIAKGLIQQGALVNAIVVGDETALINASWHGHFDMVRLLVRQGADVNLSVRAMAWDGWQLRSPIKMAKTNRIKQFLIQSGAIP